MTHAFVVTGAIDPQTLPRVVGQLARQWVTPTRVLAERVGGDFVIHFETDDLPPEKASLITASLRSNVLVHQVTLINLPTSTHPDLNPIGSAIVA